MRPLAALVLVLATACSHFLSGADDNRVTTTIGLPADSALRVAATQLQHHGFRVYELGNGVIMTAPQPVPAHATGDQPGSGTQQEMWIVRVSAERLSFVRGSRLMVSAYTMPPGATQVTDTRLEQNAIPVTLVRNPRLFREVEAVAGWINDAASRRAGEM